MPYSGAGLSGTSAQSDNALAASDGGMWGCYDSNVHRCAGEPQMTHSPCVELSEAPCTRLGYPQHWAIACARDPHGRDRSATRSTTDRAAASRELCSHSTRWGRPESRAHRHRYRSRDTGSPSARLISTNDWSAGIYARHIRRPATSGSESRPARHEHAAQMRGNARRSERDRGVVSQPTGKR